MYKIINDNKVTIPYSLNKKNMELLLGIKKFPDEIDFHVESISNIELIDGFNFNDTFIVSENARNIIKGFHEKEDVTYIKTNIYIRNKKNINYFTMIIHKNNSVSAISDKYIDSSFDSRFPVRNIKSKYNIFSDSFLFFPVISKKLKEELVKMNCNISFFKYPICTKTNGGNINSVYLTPLAGVFSETKYFITPNCSFYQCMESGHIWLTKKDFFNDIEKIISKYPHRSIFYKKISKEWMPNENQSIENHFDLIIHEK